MKPDIRIERCNYEDENGNVNCRKEIDHVVVYLLRNGDTPLSESHMAYCEDHIEEALDYAGNVGDYYTLTEWHERFEIHKMQQKEMT